MTWTAGLAAGLAAGVGVGGWCGQIRHRALCGYRHRTDVQAQRALQRRLEEAREVCLGLVEDRDAALAQVDDLLGLTPVRRPARRLRAVEDTVVAEARRSLTGQPSVGVTR